MKLRPNQNSTQPRIFDGGYVHPWYEKTDDNNKQLIKPNPPSKEAVERAKFRDKTYHWQRNSSVRSRNERTTK